MRVNISVPDELYAEVKQLAISPSAVCQRALTAEVRRVTAAGRQQQPVVTGEQKEAALAVAATVLSDAWNKLQTAMDAFAGDPDEVRTRQLDNAMLAYTEATQVRDAIKAWETKEGRS